MHLFIPLVALTVLIIVIAFLIKSRKRVEPPVRPQPVETNIIGLDTAPHNQLRNLVRPIVPDVDDVKMSFLGETTEHDARFIIESMCRRERSGTWSASVQLRIQRNCRSGSPRSSSGMVTLAPNRSSGRSRSTNSRLSKLGLSCQRVIP